MSLNFSQYLLNWRRNAVHVYARREELVASSGIGSCGSCHSETKGEKSALHSLESGISIVCALLIYIHIIPYIYINIYIPKSPKAVLFESLGKVPQKGIIAEKP